MILKDPFQVLQVPLPEACPQVPEFDPANHLNYRPSSHKYTFQELNVNGDDAIAPYAASEAFELFTPEAIQIMRAELLNQQIIGKYSLVLDPFNLRVRGHTESTPFTYNAWTHPETLEAMSREAGISLVPVYDYEVGHVNICINHESDRAEDVKGNQLEAKGLTDSDRVLEWHKDCYPFACVLMLSDTNKMVGGNTMIRTGNSAISLGCRQGSAVLLQGLYTEHCALVPKSGNERITMVTFLRPKSPLAKDETSLRTAWNVSDRRRLYADWVEYRMRILRQRLEVLANSVHSQREQDLPFAKDFVVDFLQHQVKDYVEKTCAEMV